MTITRLRGLTDEEYAVMQQAAKHFTFPVSLRIHRQRYAYGAIDIRPTKRYKHAFTPEQVDAIIAFCDGYGLVETSGLMTSPHAQYIYRAGFHYLRKLA